jgi:hypothetical protein
MVEGGRLWRAELRILAKMIPAATLEERPGAPLKDCQQIDLGSGNVVFYRFLCTSET